MISTLYADNNPPPASARMAGSGRKRMIFCVRLNFFTNVRRSFLKIKQLLNMAKTKSAKPDIFT